MTPEQNNQLLNYIAQSRSGGASDEQIRQALLGAGWQETDIALAFNPATEIIYAGFWRRVVASIIDSIIFFLFGLILIIIYFFSENKMIGIILSLLSPLYLLYPILMESSTKQATLGKMIMGLKVVDINGNKLSVLRSVGRNLAKIISMLILGIGFIMVGFTKKKQGLHDIIAECLVVKKSKSHLGLAILAIGLSFVLITVGIGAYVYYIKWPQMKQGFDTSMKVMSEPDKISDIKPLPEKIVTKSKEPIAVTEAEYDALLAKPLEGFEGTKVGPAVLQISQFWDNPKSPHLWIKTKLPMLPNFNFGQRVVKMIINNVYDKNSNDIYDRDSGLEEPFFYNVIVSETKFPMQHLEGIRDVQIKTGAKENDIASIDGKFILQLPLDIKEISFDQQELNQNKTVGDIIISVTSIGSSQVSWTFQGDGNRYIKLLAYNANNEELQFDSGTYPSNSNLKKPMPLKSLFNGDIASVKIFIASKIVEREYPFVLTK